MAPDQAGSVVTTALTQLTTEGGDMDDHLEVSAEYSDNDLSVTASGNGSTILKAAGIVAIAAICLI
jgi:hypothetical protein